MNSHFAPSGDVDFCPECGAIFPLPGTSATVKCKGCGFEVDTKAFDGLKTFSSLVVSEVKKEVISLKSSDFAGPMVDRICAKCAHVGMAFSTRQTRSADEGQTVFFTCPECRYKEIEYS